MFVYVFVVFHDVWIIYIYYRGFIGTDGVCVVVMRCQFYRFIGSRGGLEGRLGGGGDGGGEKQKLLSEIRRFRREMLERRVKDFLALFFHLFQCFFHRRGFPYFVFTYYCYAELWL